jgi:hypothetical protein
MSDLSCKTCLWWVSRERVPRNNSMLPEGFGECRRRAPNGMTMSVTTSGDGKVAVAAFAFPPVADEDFCGEWVEVKA